MKTIMVAGIGLSILGFFIGTYCLFGLLGIAAGCGLLLLACWYSIYRLCLAILLEFDNENAEQSDMNEYTAAELDVPEGFYQQDFLHAVN